MADRGGVEAAAADATDWRQRLVQARLRPTRARVAVLALLGQAGAGRMNAEAIYQKLGAQERRASLGTVYRILKELERHRLVMRDFDQDGRAWYMNWPAVAPAHLIHIVCRDGGQTLRLSDAALHRRVAELLAAQGWQLGEGPLMLQLSATPAQASGSRGAVPRSAAPARGPGSSVAKGAAARRGAPGAGEDGGSRPADAREPVPAGAQRAPRPRAVSVET